MTGNPEIEGGMLGAPVGPALGTPVGIEDGKSLAMPVGPALGDAVRVGDDGANVGPMVATVGETVVTTGAVVTPPLPLGTELPPLPCKLLLTLLLLSLLFLESEFIDNGTKTAQAITTIVAISMRTLKPVLNPPALAGATAGVCVARGGMLEDRLEMEGAPLIVVEERRRKKI